MALKLLDLRICKILCTFSTTKEFSDLTINFKYYLQPSSR